ncbi:lipoyl domain-containing protein [Brucella rhizosphaerae]|uniref:lipoyl domain-containing protein n=1 Tax=Brucella rhizosphaerae TaxID=571254 RepID=UPI0036151D87
MESGTLARWLKRDGDAVEKQEVIAEIEIDKATMELEAPVSGILGESHFWTARKMCLLVQLLASCLLTKTIMQISTSDQPA